MTLHKSGCISFIQSDVHTSQSHTNTLCIQATLALVIHACNLWCVYTIENLRTPPLALKSKCRFSLISIPTVYEFISIWRQFLSYNYYREPQLYKAGTTNDEIWHTLLILR